MIILMAGLPGSGKTTLARELASRCNGIVLNKDEIRAALFPPAEIEYSTPQDDFCMKLMLETAEYLVASNPLRMVFLDGRPFSRSYQIEQVIHAAETYHQPWRIVHCVCSEETARERLQEEGHVAGNRNFDLYRRIKSNFESITRPQIMINTDRPLGDCVDLALRGLSST